MDVHLPSIHTLLVSFLFSMLINQYTEVEARKNCRLQKHPLDLTYFLSCDGYLEDKETRTTVRREKKEKKTKRGSPGPPGPQGPPGNDGQIGPEGPTGPVGPTGPTGVPGRRGPTGPQGQRGPKGSTGPMGAQGFPGLPGNCIKETSLLNKEIKGKKYHCLAGPQGPQGQKGDRGLTGQPGIPGKEGAHGPKGEIGLRGRRGPVGMPGLPGTIGQVECTTHFSEWIGRFSHLDDKSSEGFFCPTGQFLQGFKLEKEGIKERYKYVCCSLT